MNEITPQDQTDFDAIRSLMQQGEKCARDAGGLIVRKLDAGFTAAQISEATGIMRRVICTLEKIGRDQLLPSLVFSPFDAAPQVAKLQISEQRRLVEQNEPVEVLIVKTGGPETLQVSVRDLTPTQAKQVFGKDGIRPASAQRAFIESERSRQGKSDTQAYKIDDRGIRFLGFTGYLSFRELKKIIAREEGRVA